MILNRKRLTTLLGIVLCVALAAALLKWSGHYRAKLAAEAAAPGEEAAEASPAASYNALTYYNGSTTLDFVLNEAGKWVWTADPSFPLDDSTIQAILALLENLQPLQTMEAPEELEEYDLGASPAATLKASGEAGSLSLIFGKETDGGGRFVLKDEDDSTIYIMSPALLEPMSVPIYDMMVLPKVPELAATRLDFIRVYGQATGDGAYATYTILTAQRPEVAEGETLEAADVTWRFNGANVTNDPTVQALLESLTTLTIDKCVDYNPSADAAAHCGFDAPVATLEVDFQSEGGAGQTLKLTIGNQLPDGSGRYVRYGDEDPTLYRLTTAALDPLLRIAQEGLEA